MFTFWSRLRKATIPSVNFGAFTVTNGDWAGSGKFFALPGFRVPNFSPDAKLLEPITSRAKLAR